MRYGIKVGAIALAAYLVFVMAVRHLPPVEFNAEEVPGSVVLPAPLQTVLYLGDRYLAANVETARVLITGGPAANIPQDYFERLHLTVAKLNPCHEDNYYVANSLLAWAGSVNAALSILAAATECRFWDEMVPFYWGYNLYFFRGEHRLARDLLFESARRSPKDADMFQRAGIIFEAEAYPDVHAAHDFLSAERERATSAKLRRLLDMRIGRLAALIVLRDAQSSYEKRFGHALSNPDELIRTGILKQIPADPTGLGFVFEDGQIALREMRVRKNQGAHQ